MVNDCWTCCAASQPALPAWLASMMQVPTPVNDTTPEPLILHAPAVLAGSMLNVTG